LTDESYIKITLELAKKGMGKVSPNPLVGCIIIKNDRIIGAGYHQGFGGKHAEINAIESAKENLEGSTIYVNLEPCSHQGKTPPCVEKIIENKIGKVVIGTMDMNPLVSGTGIRKLKRAGVDVKVGVLEKECIQLNRFFFKFITKKIPYVTLKMAQTIDGKIADRNGDSKWISSLPSRRYVHTLRSYYDAVLIGTGTLLKDDPSLTVRLTEGRNPKRIIIDTNLKVRTSHKIFLNNADKNLIIATSKSNVDRKRKLKKLESLGVEMLFVKKDEGNKLNLKNLLKELGKINISSVLVEGGSGIFTSFVQKSLFDNILVFMNPRILGSGIPVIGSIGVKSIKRALKVKINHFEKIGDDLLVDLSN
jgi:diaminohydroxyphosphoribosylaminopyrimidine deaminase / 5-amino-6-(5-phosphoribosylamino)uracil reductase